MSELCSLMQISSHLLQRVRETPSVLELFLNIIPTATSPEFIDYFNLYWYRKIENIHDLSPENIHLLSDILVDPEQAVGQLTLRPLQMLEDWRLRYLEDYNRLKSEIYQILIEGQTLLCLDLKEIWDEIGYLFRGSVYSETQSFLTQEATNKEIRVEVIFGGQKINGDNAFISFIESNEVREIAVALSKITEEVIRKRFEQGRDTQPKLYRSNWSEEDYQGILQICIEIIDFYIDAANQGKGILIDLG